MASLTFPSRFLKKLEIYQQIGRGKGLAKHKRLWEQEAAFLQWAYGEGHQHERNWVNYERFRTEIAKELKTFPSALKELEETIGNLYFKGLIEVHKIDPNWKKDLNDPHTKDKEFLTDGFNPTEAQYVNKFSQDFKIRPSLTGLEVGELLAEINHSVWWLRGWNRFKYWSSVKAIWIVLLVSFILLVALFVTKFVHFLQLLF